MRSFERRNLTRTMLGLVAGVSLFAAAACGSDDGRSQSTTDAPAATTPGRRTPPSTRHAGSTRRRHRADRRHGTTNRLGDVSRSASSRCQPDAHRDHVRHRCRRPGDRRRRLLELPGRGARRCRTSCRDTSRTSRRSPAYEPDLVLTGGDFTDLGQQLDDARHRRRGRAGGVTLDDTYAQIEQLGAATGHVAEAAELVGQMQTDIDAGDRRHCPVAGRAADATTTSSTRRTSAPTATRSSGAVRLLGLQNIADQAEVTPAPYPQLNAEFIISAEPRSDLPRRHEVLR